MTTDEFNTHFRTEHREIRDLILNLMSGFIKEDRELCDKSLTRLAEVIGPHFRYEEKTVYPFLTEFYGEDYIQKLLTDHDIMIGRALMIKQIIDNEFDNNERRNKGLEHVRGLLPHVSDCEGVSIMVERLGEDKLVAIKEAIDEAYKDNYNLVEWAENVRDRNYSRFSK